MSQQFTDNHFISLNRKHTMESGVSRCLVCGLGSLGQYCVAKLKEFGVVVSGIDVAQPSIWEVASVPDLLEDLVLGDCRQPDILERALVQQCQAVLLVTSDERVNIDAAFAVRVLNSQVRLIVRSAKQNLNELLNRKLGNFEALEATQIPAPAFAIAALGSEIQGFINFGARLLRVVKSPIDPHHKWCDHRLLYELNSRTRRVLSHIPALAELPTEFYQWEPDARICSGDIVAYIEESEGLAAQLASANLARKKTKQNFSQFWQEIGDRLVVLTTIDSLQRIKQGKMLPRCWQVQIDRALTTGAVFEGARVIVQISGCAINIATELMHHLPGILPIPLYKHQAQRCLVRELSKAQTLAHLIPFPSCE